MRMPCGCGSFLSSSSVISRALSGSGLIDGLLAAQELRDVCLAVDADTVVFDNELSPAQQYNLEKVLGRTSLDRTAVILDIFAQNAHTLEGKAQVELALLRYRLPRLQTTVKIGANNLTNQYIVQAYGSPAVGGLYYVALTYTGL